jgi:hypothetical protein
MRPTPEQVDAADRKGKVWCMDCKNFVKLCPKSNEGGSLWKVCSDYIERDE